jgi:hypothetical protein
MQSLIISFTVLYSLPLSRHIHIKVIHRISFNPSPSLAVAKTVRQMHIEIAHVIIPLAPIISTCHIKSTATHVKVQSLIILFAILYSLPLSRQPIKVIHRTSLNPSPSLAGATTARHMQLKLNALSFPLLPTYYTNS